MNVHASYMDRLYAEGIVLRDTLTFENIRDRGGHIVDVRLAGRVECGDDLVVVVDKHYETAYRSDGRMLIRADSYLYHAFVRNGTDVIRYDTAHGFDDLHRHVFDPASGESTREHIELDELPTLDGAIREAAALVAARITS